MSFCGMNCTQRLLEEATRNKPDFLHLQFPPLPPQAFRPVLTDHFPNGFSPVAGAGLTNEVKKSKIGLAVNGLTI